jgi:hypothetical protein
VALTVDPCLDARLAADRYTESASALLVCRRLLFCADVLVSEG